MSTHVTPVEAPGRTTPFAFACPECRSPLKPFGDDQLRCADHTYQRKSGIWHMLPAHRAATFQPFVNDYETVRNREGRGSSDSAYYRNLPFADTTGRFSNDWRIRAKSYTTLLTRVVEPMVMELARPLTIVDIGAGNGWLSGRLAGRGHNLAAVDLLTNPNDGLGAHTHYEAAFTPIQAEFDHLPFADRQFDLVIFNGALHYSTDYGVTLREALRVMRPDGQLVIMDSPVYHHTASGAAMVREREAEFKQRYGFPSNALPSENFLTYDRLTELGDALGLELKFVHPFYGVSWALRPWKARLRRRREPARFLLIVGAPGTTTQSMSSRPKWRDLGLFDASAGRRSLHFGRDDMSRRQVISAAGRYWLRLRYRLTQRHRYNRLVLEEVAGQPMLVLPQVFNPKLLRSGAFLAEALREDLIPAGASILDMGTGSGVGALAAAARARQVVAVDINPHAVRCARINAMLNDVEDRIEVRHGDLFTPVRGERFDVVLFNPPYYRGAPRDDLDHAWRSIDVVERFAAGLADYLTAEGYALIVLSTDGETASFLASFEENGFTVTPIVRRTFINETLTLYRMNTLPP